MTQPKKVPGAAAPTPAPEAMAVGAPTSSPTEGADTMAEVAPDAPVPATDQPGSDTKPGTHIALSP